MESPYRMESGYAWILPIDEDWKGSSSEEWETEMMTDSMIKGASYVGWRLIDMIGHSVFTLTDGRYAAQRLFQRATIYKVPQ